MEEMPTIRRLSALALLALLGCGGGEGSTPGSSLSETPNYSVALTSGTATRQLDLLFMIDNSPSMAPKVNKLVMQFPKLIDALKWPTDGTLPDLRIAIIDSDLGTGGAYTNNSCGPKTLPDGTQSIFGDMGRFQMPNYPLACTFTSGALFLESKAGQPVNYGGDLSTVFACLATNLGDRGCGEEHQIQAFEFALAAQGVGNENQQKAFLRGNATLGLVFLTDEDDCSAATNDRLFGDLVDARGETASLRCATRAHRCNGRNLADSPPGYPTTEPFTARFADCQARTGDECSLDTDTSKPTDCNPLRNVKTLAEEIKSLKESPDDVFVAGIFGWPSSAAELATATYKIAPVPNPNTADTAHPTIYDYWPVCYDPNHPPSNPDSATGFDAEAAAWGATGGLRQSAFIDEFGSNGMKLSACQPDFADAMTQIGTALTRAGPSGQGYCVPTALAQSSQCMAHLRRPMTDGKTFVTDPGTVPLCGPQPIIFPCYDLAANSPSCASGDSLLTMQSGSSTTVGFAPGTTLDFYCQ
jgi:hypothetical protein